MGRSLFLSLKEKPNPREKHEMAKHSRAKDSSDDAVSSSSEEEQVNDQVIDEEDEEELEAVARIAAEDSEDDDNDGVTAGQEIEDNEVREK